MEKEKLSLYESTGDDVFEKIERQFNTMMSAMDVQGYCHIKYKEDHPKHANFSGIVTCNGGMLNEGFYWIMEYNTAAQTAEDFVNAVKAKLFDMVSDAAYTADAEKTYGYTK